MDKAESHQKFLRLPWLFLIALTVYLGVRLTALEDFPIFFFTDEAIQSVHASDLIRDGLRSEEGEFLPTYFKNGNQYNLSTSVYLQVLPVMWFGKQVWVTRGVSVLVTVFAALSIGLFTQTILKIKSGWITILLFSIMPAWFYHSRTAFETVLAVSFYACFILSYALYREKNAKFILPAVIFAALCFYSYSPAQVVITVTILALGLSDLRYHWHKRKLLLWAFILGMICLIPYIRFNINHPQEFNEHLHILGSYWVQDISVIKKLGIYFTNYFSGLNPLYWFLPGEDLVRHVMKGYGHLLRPAFPFFLVGLISTLKNLNRSPYRMILISLLAAPSGAAVAEIGITRALFMVIPATLLTTLGVWKVITWLLNQTMWGEFKLKEQVVFGALFVGLIGANFAILQDALRNGGVWFTEYGMFGMQYGARQVFSKIETVLINDQQTKIYLSPDWANGTDILARYFFEDPLPFSLTSIDPYLQEKKEITDDDLFILTPEEYQKVIESGKFSRIDHVDRIPYPNGQTGFYLTRLGYAQGVEAIFAEEDRLRHQMVQNIITLQNGRTASVHYSPLDMGEIKHVFDGDLFTLARTWEANPFVLQLVFEQPQTIQTILIKIGGEATQLTIKLWPSTSNEVVLLQKTVPDTPEPREISLSVEQEQIFSRAEIYVENVHNDQFAHVHLWEVKLISESIP